MAEMDAEQSDGGIPPVLLPQQGPMAASGKFRLLLELPGSAAETLRHSPWLTRHAARRPVVRRQSIVVYDTPDWALGRAGIALGTVTMGKRRTQLLRDIRQPAGGPVPRDWDGVLLTAATALPVATSAAESDAEPSAAPPPTGAATLDLTRLAFTPADPAIVARITATNLRPAFAIELTRTSWTLQLGTGTVVLAIELGTIEAAAGKRTVALTEVRVDQGDPAHLFAAATALAREVPIRLADRGLEQLGYGLASGEDWWQVDPSRPPLHRTMTVRDGFLAIGQANVVALARLTDTLASTPKAPEGQTIHQTRVVLRRLRSMLSIFGPVLPQLARRQVGQALGALASALGEARDWDVFTAETLMPLGAALGDEPILRELRLGAAVLRERAAGTIARQLSTPEFLTLRLRLAAWFEAGIWPEAPTPEAAAALDRPLVEYARDTLGHRHKRLLRGAEHLTDPAPASWHELRIEAKKLRYAVEVFRPLFHGKTTRQYLDMLREVQEILGKVNDGLVARGMIARLSPAGGEAAARAAGLIAGWTAAEVGTARKHFAETWRGFEKARRFWKDGR